MSSLAGVGCDDMILNFMLKFYGSWKFNQKNVKTQNTKWRIQKQLLESIFFVSHQPIKGVDRTIIWPIVAKMCRDERKTFELLTLVGSWFCCWTVRDQRLIFGDINSVKKIRRMRCLTRGNKTKKKSNLLRRGCYFIIFGRLWFKIKIFFVLVSIS